jgi:hypothetical protein
MPMQDISMDIDIYKPEAHKKLYHLYTWFIQVINNNKIWNYQMVRGILDLGQH